MCIRGSQRHMWRSHLLGVTGQHSKRLLIDMLKVSILSQVSHHSSVLVSTLRPPPLYDHQVALAPLGLSSRLPLTGAMALRCSTTSPISHRTFQGRQRVSKDPLHSDEHTSVMFSWAIISCMDQGQNWSSRSTSKSHFWLMGGSLT